MAYDVIIVGAGPAGLLAAHELANNSSKKVLVVEQGSSVENRSCPMQITGTCTKCNWCNILCGVGGAGLFSDGKLNIGLYTVPSIKGNLTELLPAPEARKLLKEIDTTLLSYGVPDELYGTEESIKKLRAKAMKSGIRFIQFDERHVGSDRLPAVISKMVADLKKNGVEFKTGFHVDNVEKPGDNFKVKGNGQVFTSKKVILSPGRQGAQWLIKFAEKKNLEMEHNPADVGVRVEVPDLVMREVTDEVGVWDPKFVIRTKKFDDQIRTFCTNPRGFVVKEDYNKYVSVNGFASRDKESKNTNFAFLNTINLTSPVEDTAKYAISIAKLVYTIGGGKPIIQRLADIRNGRRSTWRRIEKGVVDPTLRDVTPGDISMALPYRLTSNIIEGLDMLDNIIPGIAGDSTLLYAPEIKLYSRRIKTDQNLQTKINGLYVAGDGAGVSRQIMTAAATGVIAARGIISK